MSHSAEGLEGRGRGLGRMKRRGGRRRRRRRRRTIRCKSVLQTGFDCAFIKASFSADNKNKLMTFSCQRCAYPCNCISLSSLLSHLSVYLSVYLPSLPFNGPTLQLMATEAHWNQIICQMSQFTIVSNVRHLLSCFHFQFHFHFLCRWGQPCSAGVPGSPQSEAAAQQHLGVVSDQAHSAHPQVSAAPATDAQSHRYAGRRTRSSLR